MIPGAYPKGQMRRNQYLKVVLWSSVLVNMVLIISCFLSRPSPEPAVPQLLQSSIQNFTLLDCPVVLPNITSRKEVSPGVTCLDKELSFRQGQRWKYWVLYNFIPAQKSFSCNETVTYTTLGGLKYLDNIEPLLARWNGPISLAVYAPGEDFKKSLETIFFYRDCKPNNLVKDLVTFHLFFDMDHIPENIEKYDQVKNLKGNCSGSYEWKEDLITYQKLKNLEYPINLARNIARESAQTHFVFASDLELYPSPGLIPSFMEMIKRGNGPGDPSKPRVYVSSIFEIQENASHLPVDKKELVKMLDEGIVIPFHKHVCSSCHNIPHAENWTRAPLEPGLRVLHVGKRLGPFKHWEPIYIGTNSEPQYDDRLTWDGRGDKMPQMYKLCIMDYEFHILDNAFLIHRPGIQTREKLKQRMTSPKVAAQGILIRRTIIPEIHKLYGTREGCDVV